MLIWLAGINVLTLVLLIVSLLRGRTQGQAAVDPKLGEQLTRMDARNEALELAIAWIQHRSVVSERYVRRI